MHCLVVDPNVAFATLLSEELERLGYEVTTCATAIEAYSAVRDAAPAQAPQMAFLDMGLRNPDALSLGHQLRAVTPSIRLVLIPMIGEEPVLGRDAPVIQGVLPKPFFLPELPERIEAALSSLMSPVSASAVSSIPEAVLPPPLEAEEVNPSDVDLASLDWASALAVVSVDEAVDTGVLDGVADGVAVVDVVEDAGVPVPDVVSPASGDGRAMSGAPPMASHQHRLSRRALRANHEQIMAVIGELGYELGADAVLLTCDTGVLAWWGSLDEGDVTSISDAVLNSRRASEELARILGREQLLFEQSIAGGGYLLYALNVHEAVLAVIVSGSAPLGLLRHRTRNAGERIAELCAFG